MKNNKTKILAVGMVLLMVLTSVCVIESTEETDAATLPYYKYVMTYSNETITQVDVYDSPSHIVKTITTKNALDSFWAFDTTTGYGPFNSCYAAINVSDGTVAFHLQPNNLKRQLGASSDMTTQELANYNIVWLIPTVYWSATSTTLTLTNSSTEGGTAYAHSVVSPTAKTYPFIGIGVYEASTATVSGNTALMSQSGKSPTASQTIGTFDGYGQNTPGDAILWNFYHWTFTKMATYMVGMGKNTQQIWGEGRTISSAAATTGLGDTAGAYASGQTTYSKVFIENSWGSVNEWVGSTTLSNRTLYLTTTTGGNSSYLSTIGTSQGVSLPSSSGWITGTSKASATWDLPTSSSSTDNSSNVAYPGDYVASGTGVRVLYVGGNWFGNTLAGVSTAFGGENSNSTFNNVGARLAYYLDADPFAPFTTTVTISPNTVGYGTVSQSNVSDIEIDSSITVNGNKITFSDGTEVTASPTASDAQYTYAFTGWSIFNGATVTENMSITANFSRTTNTYTVTWKNGDNNTIETDLNVPYGTVPTYNGSTPTKTSTAQYTYTWDNGWSPTVTAVTGNATYTATFTATTNNYTVTVGTSPAGYGTVNNSSITVPYGTSISASGNVLTVGSYTSTASPTASDAQYTYSFSSWTGIPVGGTVTGNTSVTANFTRAVNNYNVSIAASNNAYGSVAPTAVASVPYGNVFTIDGNNLKITDSTNTVRTITPTPTASGAQYTYTFAGWTYDNGGVQTPIVSGTTAVTAATSVTANFTQTLNTYTVTVSVAAGSTGYGTLTKSLTTELTTTTISSVPYGSQVAVSGDTITVNGTSVQAVPTANTAEWTYTFGSWSVSNNTPINGDTTITASFARDYTRYIATILSSNTQFGTVDVSEITNVPYGDTIHINGNQLTLNNVTVTASPNNATVEWTYTFTGWSVGDGDHVYANISITATFTSTQIMYLLSFGSNDANYGSVDAVSWYSAGNGTFTVDNANGTLTVSYQDPSNVTQTKTITATPASPTPKFAYSFVNWTYDNGGVQTAITNNTIVTSAMTITANFTYSIREYNVTVNVNNVGWGTLADGTLTGQNTITIPDVPYDSVITVSGNTITVNGTTVTATYAAADAQYTYGFGSWSVSNNQTTTDSTVITANFSRTVNTYTVTFQVGSSSTGYGSVDLASVASVPYGSKFTISGNVITINGTDVTADPEDNTAQYTYTFVNFTDHSDDSAIVSGTTEVQGNMTIDANFTRTINQYTLTITEVDPANIGTLTGSLSITADYGTPISYTANTITVGASPDEQTVTASYPASDAQYTYTFAWSSTSVTQLNADLQITATFTRTLNTYTITWQNYDGTTLETDAAVPYGQTPTYDGATPSKASDAQYRYVWAGWSPSVASVTGAQTYTAIYNNITQTYTITWQNYDGTTLETDLNVPYGTTPTYDGETPIRESTAQYSYTFDTWSPSVASVTGAQTYTATFTETVRSYTVTWKDGDDQTLYSETLDYGDTPVYSGADPTKTATAQYTYTWNNGWTPTVVNVVGDATYTATFTATVNGYTITWNNYDDSTLDTDTVDYGDTPEYTGATPTKASTAQYSYTFAGWTPTIVPVTGNATYTATFTETVRSYTITWNNWDNTTLDIDTVEYGQTPVYAGATPTKASTAEYSYTFAGWSPAIASVTGDATYTAQFTSATRTYTVTWVNWDDSVLETDLNVEYGQTPTYDGATPIKASTAEYSYTFSGWSPTVVSVTGDATYTAQYSSATRSYTITWNNWDNTTLDTDTVAYGQTPVYTGATPTKASTAQYSYIFDTWSPAIASVTGDATYTATFTATTRTYTVSWVNGDATLETDLNVPYGTVPTYNGSTPTKASTAQYSYTFTGWSPAVAAITGDTTYSAQFSQNVRSYTITWQNYDGTELDTDSVAYGQTPVYTGATPTRASTAQYSYTFDTWSPAIATVTEDATYTATFTSTVRSYTITWKNYDGTTLETDTVQYGQTPTYDGATPTKAATPEYSYVFDTWSPAVTSVTGNATYTATFTEIMNGYTVTWNNYNGTTLETDLNVLYGQTPTYDGATPTKASDAQYNYTFAGWSPAVGPISGDTTYTATFTSTVRSYTITWIYGEDSDTTTVEYGQTPTHADPEPPAGDVFMYWTPTIVPVTGNATYTAYFVTQFAVTITFNASTNGGEVVGSSTESVDYRDTFGTLPTATKSGYVFIGWFTAAEGGELITSSSVNLFTDDTTLYAQFEIGQSLGVSKAFTYLTVLLILLFMVRWIVKAGILGV